eukprot:6194966-Pleurochrysis_carterae.AAC.2
MRSARAVLRHAACRSASFKAGTPHASCSNGRKRQVASSSHCQQGRSVGSSAWASTSCHMICGAPMSRRAAAAAVRRAGAACVYHPSIWSTVCRAPPPS